jgi:hypothetical protein
VLTVRVLQGSDACALAALPNVQLRCLGSATLLVPGQSDSSIGMTRLEITDGHGTQVGFCLMSFCVKRSPTNRVSDTAKLRFASDDFSRPATDQFSRAHLTQAAPSICRHASNSSRHDSMASSPRVPSTSPLLPSTRPLRQAENDDEDDTSAWVRTLNINSSASTGNGYHANHGEDLHNDHDTPLSRHALSSLRTTASTQSPPAPSPGGILKNCQQPNQTPVDTPAASALRTPPRGNQLLSAEMTEPQSPSEYGSRVRIECIRTYSNPHEGYTVFVFRCARSGYEHWEIRRRFRDFQLLHTRLGRALDGKKLSELTMSYGKTACRKVLFS